MSSPLSPGVMLSFASYYGDHMVLQKAPAGAVVWGYGAPGAAVTVLLTGEGGLVIAKKVTRVEGWYRTFARGLGTRVALGDASNPNGW